jgi:hypothetical protein
MEILKIKVLYLKARESEESSVITIETAGIRTEDKYIYAGAME